MTTGWVTALRINTFKIKTQKVRSLQWVNNPNKHHTNLIHQQTPEANICKNMQKINHMHYRRQIEIEDASRRALRSQAGAISQSLQRMKQRLAKMGSIFSLNYLLIKTKNILGRVVLLWFYIKPMVSSVTCLYGWELLLVHYFLIIGD